MALVTAIEIIFVMDRWYLGNVILGPKFNPAIVVTNLKSNDTFCCGDKFPGRAVWFIDKICSFGNQRPVSDPSPQTHQPRPKLLLSSCFLKEYNFSQIFLFNWVRCNLILTRSQLDIPQMWQKWHLKLLKTQVLHCHYQSLNIANAVNIPLHPHQNCAADCWTIFFDKGGWNFFQIV